MPKQNPPGENSGDVSSRMSDDIILHSNTSVATVEAAESGEARRSSPSRAVLSVTAQRLSCTLTGPGSTGTGASISVVVHDVEGGKAPTMVVMNSLSQPYLRIIGIAQHIQLKRGKQYLKGQLVEAETVYFYPSFRVARCCDLAQIAASRNQLTQCSFQPDLSGTNDSPLLLTR
ncbi:hypothetical protein RRG08_036025 [Elysia crispata]|uniref:Uncharacterized protein n=1 Tax=Elysia crispata TaxID=231223 RepID=A0AAE1AN26_9GAST|nr:hypothetical protein RRG08_036025 [Elysia crispata]